MSYSCAICETNYLITGLSENWNLYFHRNRMLIESRNNKINYFAREQKLRLRCNFQRATKKLCFYNFYGHLSNKVAILMSGGCMVSYFLYVEVPCIYIVYHLSVIMSDCVWDFVGHWHFSVGHSSNSLIADWYWQRCIHMTDLPCSYLDSVTWKCGRQMKVTILVNKHIYSKQLMICHLTYHNLIWSHVNNTRSVSYKAVNF